MITKEELFEAGWSYDHTKNPDSEIPTTVYSIPFDYSQRGVSESFDGDTNVYLNMTDKYEHISIDNGGTWDGHTNLFLGIVENKSDLEKLMIMLRIN